MLYKYILGYYNTTIRNNSMWAARARLFVIVKL
jgi:hypothetical protein